MQKTPTIKPNQTQSHFHILSLGMNPFDCKPPSSFSLEESSSSSSSSSSSAFSSSTSAPGSSSQARGAGSSSQKRKAGRKKFKETRHSVYKRVRQRNGKWVCELRQPYKRNRIWLGTFPCPDMAARAYDVAALAIKGDSASLNFPESVGQLPRAASSSVKDIRSAALKAAQTFQAKEQEKEKESQREDKDSYPCRQLFVDEEALFNMPTLLDSLAEGLILTPPALTKGFNWDDIGVVEDSPSGLTDR